MVCTDSVGFTSPHTGLTLSDKLGEWEEKKHDNLTIFKPGVYWHDGARANILAGEAPIFKARGINHKAFSEYISQIDDLFQAFAADPTGQKFPQITYRTDFGMITAKQALHRNKWELAGKVESRSIDQDSNPFHKRTDVRWDPEAHLLRTRPYEQSESLTSYGYQTGKARNAFAEVAETAGAPGADDDFPSGMLAAFGDTTTPDGPSSALFFGALGTGQWA
jgi:hypothetical protein